MLAHPTQERLLALGLPGMARALDDQRRQPDIAALRQEAVVEDVDLRAPRSLDRALFQKLAAGDWIKRKQNLLIVGPTGVGKSWIACALGHKACRDNRSVVYHRVPGCWKHWLWPAATAAMDGY